MIDADAGGYGNVGVIHQPDNVETTKDSVLVQEDPGGHNQGATTARVWRYDLSDGTQEVVARVDQAQAPAGTALGAWESSGIVDVSSVFGAGSFLVDVQAGSLILEERPGPDLNGDGTPNWVDQREGGQLLLVKIPGA